ncbi:MAG TPA: hypothetical protein VL126_11135 [Bacteroidota bacterium]|nr:hypothetical protein [Bacteroidota bacterium]
MLMRVILYAMVGYFLYRLIQATTRILSSDRRDHPPPKEPMGSPPKPPAEPFRDIKDADFIDITPKENGDEPPKSN